MREGKIRVNGARVKPNYRIQAGDTLTLPPLTVDAAPTQTVSPALVRRVVDSIVFEDEHLIAVNKPANVAVHRGTGVPAGVIEALRHARPHEPELELAHRLDRETSGVLLIAKTSRALRYLQRLLAEEEHRIKRDYLAVVRGAWPENTRRSHAPLHHNGKRTVVSKDRGQRAETHFRVLSRLGRHATVLHVRLLTGRKHQIRVHCQHAGHPIAGDSRYGTRANHPMLLHAHRVELPLPDGSTRVIEAPPPPYFPKQQTR